MKKIVLSALAALTIGTVAASAGDVKFYTDGNGQVFTTAGEGRTELKSKETPLFSKTSKLKFSGTHYLGYTYKDQKELSAADGGPIAQKATGNFEFRRNYLQVKAYLLEDPKSYLRVTLDTVYSSGKDGYADVYAKYAYLYLNDVLPFTGVELGMAHRPWIDYEEHQGWWMRSISKVFVEASESAHLTNSADLGFNFKTKTDYFTSELGIFNGEGYHGTNGANDEIGAGNSAEWRLTGAFLGNGKQKRKPTKDSYLDASFFGQYNIDNAANEDASGNAQTYAFYGLHAVYNMPNFLIAGQYVQADNENKGTSQYNGKGYSLNATGRFGAKKEFSVIGRYDVWTSEKQTTNVEQTTNSAIYGVAWQQNKNVKWLVSGQSFRAADNRNYKGSATQDWDSAMVTAEVHW
ncbi:hypothetical protein [Sulfurimonas sp.]|uniref:hypothetical protein n=1 Tax=Sulfurimonas sp. TaxID=2022749 RepID=UPI00356583BA